MAKKKPVILQILPALVSGGVERGTIDIARAVKEKGWTSIVLSSGGVMVSQLKRLGARHITASVASKSPFRIWKNIGLIEDIIKRHDVDIVHVRSRAPAWSAYFACQRFNKNNDRKCHFVTSWHGTHSFGSSLKKKYNSVMGRGEVVIAVSEFIRSHILEHYDVDKKNIQVIHRGADLEMFNSEKVGQERLIQLASTFNFEVDCPVILLPGRFVRWKGHLFLLKAFAKLDHARYQCVFVGKEDKHSGYVKEIKDMIIDYGLEKNVRMMNPVSDMPALYMLADIVVSASLNPEAFGRIPIEAGAMGRCCIATKHGGAMETIIDGKTGWLVEPGDVDAMVKVLDKALQIKDRTRKIMISRAREHIEQSFSLKQMCDKTLNVYRTLVKE